MKKALFRLTMCAFVLTLATGCSDDTTNDHNDNIPPVTPESETGDFYVLNEGGWGSNNSTLDFFDSKTSHYTANMFSTVNPDITLGLGDTGNDLEAYGDKLYAVMNGSGLIEVMEKTTAKHIKSIKISGARNIAFHGDYAYVTSYATTPQSPDGSLFKISTESLEIVDTCAVGRQPEGLTVSDGLLYVTNSGGYVQPDYERHISVIALDTFEAVDRIDIAVNINRIAADADGILYVGSAGNYSDIAPALYVYDTRQHAAIDTLHVAPSQIWLDDNRLFIIGTNYVTYTNTLAYYDTTTRKLNEKPLSDAVMDKMVSPYSIAVSPKTKEIILTDAKDFLSLGKIYCIAPDGSEILWESSAGITPGHIAFKCFF